MQQADKRRRLADAAPVTLHWIPLFAVVAVAYAIGSKLAFSWFGADGLSPSFFPAAGVTLAALVLVRRSRWPIVLAAAGLAEFSVDLWHDLGPLPSLGYVVANLTQPVVGALLLGALVQRVDLTRTRDLLAFLGAAVVAAPAVGGALGASTFVLLDGGAGWSVFALEWWVGDGLGVLVVGGAILSLRATSPVRLTPLRVSTGAVLGGAAVLATAAVFRFESFGFVYVPIVLLALIAFRIGTRGVAVTGAVVAFVAAQATAEGSRYWDALDISPETGLLYLQLALGVVIATALALSAEIAERERTGLELARSEAERAGALGRATVADSERRARLQAESVSRSAALFAETGTVDEVASAAVSVMAEWGADQSTFYVVEGDELVLRAAAGVGDDQRAEFGSFPLAFQAPSADAARAAEPVVVHDGAEFDRRYPTFRDYRRRYPAESLASYPVATGDLVRAVLMARAAEPRWLTDSRHELLSTLADQAAVALERASLLEEEQRARRRAELLERHAARLAAAAGVHDVARTTIVDLEAVGVSAAWVQLLRGNILELTEASGVPSENLVHFARYELDVATPPAEAARERRLVHVATGEELDRRYAAAAVGRARLPFESLVSVPLRRASGQTLGVLTLTSFEPHWLDDDRRRLVLGLAEQCGLALERAQLQHEADGAAEDAALLASLGEQLERATGTSSRALALVRALAGPRTTLAAVHMLDAGDEPARLEALADPGELADERALARVAEEALSVDDLARSVGDDLDLVAVPLRARNRALGVLTVGLAPADAMTPVLLQRIATRAALALDNALLYEQERNVSHSLQMGLLGGELGVPSDTAIATAYRPGSAALEVGGDWYDAFELPGGRLALLVGDVVGHGLEAAVAMGQLRGAVRALAPMGSPRELIERLDAFVDTLPEAAMSTLAYVELDPDGGIAYACAGHPPPLVLPDDGEPRLLWDGRSPPLGSTFSVGREEAVDRLAPGDTLILYTDGLVERRAQGISAGLDALVGAVRGAREHGPARLVDHILSEVLEGEAQDDDVCILALRRSFDDVAFVHSFPAAPGEVTRMRQRFTHWLETVDLDPEARRDVVLAVAEAAANAAEHAYAFDGEGLVHVRAAVADGTLLVRIRDEGRWREASTTSERGRGRVLMDTLMDEVSVEAGDTGTLVRMSMPLRVGALA